METPHLTRNESREVDRRATQEYGIASLVLMENAGRGVVDALERLGIDGPVLIVCGKGNNAGDGFVVARHLEIRGHVCRVVLLASAEEITGDARVNLDILNKCETEVVSLVPMADEPTALHSALERYGADVAWTVDALLGTGAKGEPRTPLDTAIDWFNQQRASKMAVDVPSGLDCDSGTTAEHTIRADHTCTFVAVKAGFTVAGACDYTGVVHVVDIGTPPKLLREVLGSPISK